MKHHHPLSDLGGDPPEVKGTFAPVCDLQPLEGPRVPAALDMQ